MKYVDPTLQHNILAKQQTSERWRHRVEVETEDKKEIRVIVGMEGLIDETKEIAK